MKKIGIFYGSSTGSTMRVAQQLGQLLNVNPDDIYDISRVAPAAVAEYDVLLLGSSTWGKGELQSDWLDFGNALRVMDLKDKTIAIFGCGNQMMRNTFCNAVGRLTDIAGETGAKIIGQFNAEGYTFNKSEAKIEDTPMMKGLVLDEGNEPQLTKPRLKAWAELIKAEIGE